MKLAFAGGDLRTIAAAELFERDGADVIRAFLGENDIHPGALRDRDAIILPLPYEKGGILNSPMSSRRINIGEILAAGNADTLFIGGGLPQQNENRVDYAKREDFLLANAVPTAEGAIEIALRELSITLNGASALVLGFGRIGKHLSRLLSSFNAKVTVAARKSEAITLAKLSGYRTTKFSDMQEAISEADVIFNTVPTVIIGEYECSFVKSGVPFIDLASSPGGIDDISAKTHSVNVIKALALPGKTAPLTAGRIVYDVISSVLRERGLCK